MAWDQYDTNVVARVFTWATSKGFAESSEGRAIGRERFIEVLAKLGVVKPEAYWPEDVATDTPRATGAPR